VLFCRSLFLNVPPLSLEIFLPTSFSGNLSPELFCLLVNEASVTFLLQVIPNKFSHELRVFKAIFMSELKVYSLCIKKYITH